MLNAIPHFWINRRADVERRALIEAYFSDGLVTHARIEATTPETLPRVAVRKPLANSLAQLAIFVSHLDAVAQAYRSGCAHALIMEDDVRSRYLFDAATLIASAPADWEILQLHVSNARIVLRLGQHYLQHGVLWHEWEPDFYSAGAYLINQRGAEHLLARYHPTGEEIDLRGVHALGKLVADHLLYRRAYCYTATVPFFSNDVALRSTHAPHRDATHHLPGEQSVQQVMASIEQQWTARTPVSPVQQASYPFALRAL